MLLDKIKNNIVFYGFIVFIVFILYLGVNFISYFHPYPFCYIGVHKDILSGNEISIKKAIILLRLKDPSAYRDLCKYVDDIKEQRCTVSDYLIEPENWKEGLDIYGCYVKGSKYIYLKPEKIDSDAVVKKRAEDIKKLTSFSKDFWDNLK